MTTNDPDTGAESGLPSLQDIHFDAMIIRGLIEAMDHFTARCPEPLHALITVSKPLIMRLADDIERVA
jgi:hypothetical protein